MIDESGNGASSCVDDHLVVKAHEIVTLTLVSPHDGFGVNIMIYLIFLVDLLHAALTLRLCNDFSSIFHNDLVRLKRSHGSHTVAAVFRVDHFDAIIVAVAFGTSPKFGKGTVATLLRSQSAVCAVTLVSHDTIVTGVSTTIFFVTIALRGILLVAFPQGRGVPNESIWKVLATM